MAPQRHQHHNRPDPLDRIADALERLAAAAAALACAQSGEHEQAVRLRALAAKLGSMANTTPEELPPKESP